MRRLFCVAAALLTASAAPLAGQQPAQAPAEDPLKDLSGLWSAKKWFGPEVRGQLTIHRTASGLRADIAGRYASVTEKGSELEFDLPGDGGRFTGRFEEAA